jgi:hypothetical protein
MIGDVLYVLGSETYCMFSADFGFDLLSIHKMTQSDLQMTFEDTSCIIRSKRPDGQSSLLLLKFVMDYTDSIWNLKQSWWLQQLLHVC